MNASPDAVHSSHYRVLPAHDDGWQVVTELGPNIVEFTYCSDWHRVERVCAELDRQRRDADATCRDPADPR